MHIEHGDHPSDLLLINVKVLTGLKITNMSISMLMVGKIKSIDISASEAIILKSIIQSSIDHRLEKRISVEMGEDIILLRHSLKNLNIAFP